MVLTLTACPECGTVAELTDEGVVESTDGPVRMVRVRCARRHWFLMPQDMLRRIAAGHRIPVQPPGASSAGAPAPP